MKTFHTTEEYWDCECDDNYIHLKSESFCLQCKAKAGESPDSRVDEVRAQGLDFKWELTEESK